jgi:hypothetical protein
MSQEWLKTILYVFALLTTLAAIYNLTNNDDMVEVECIQGVSWDGDFTEIDCNQYAMGM